MNLASIAGQELERAILRHATNWTLLPACSYVRSGAPSGRFALGGLFPGLKPWAESSNPFGAKISRCELLQNVQTPEAFSLYRASTPLARRSSPISRAIASR